MVLDDTSSDQRHHCAPMWHTSYQLIYLEYYSSGCHSVVMQQISYYPSLSPATWELWLGMSLLCIFPLPLFNSVIPTICPHYSLKSPLLYSILFHFTHQSNITITHTSQRDGENEKCTCTKRLHRCMVRTCSTTVLPNEDRYVSNHAS